MEASGTIEAAAWAANQSTLGYRGTWQSARGASWGRPPSSRGGRASLSRPLPDGLWQHCGPRSPAAPSSGQPAPTFQTYLRPVTFGSESDLGRHSWAFRIGARQTLEPVAERTVPATSRPPAMRRPRPGRCKTPVGPGAFARRCRNTFVRNVAGETGNYGYWKGRGVSHRRHRQRRTNLARNRRREP